MQSFRVVLDTNQIVAAGTRWQDVPEDWLCPECQMGKDDFDMVEI